jgi:hypothetical protein
MKPTASNDLIAGAKYEWAKAYKTDVAESRLRKELGPLGNSPPGEVLASLRTYMALTKAQFFSWTKWRDAWRAFLTDSTGSDEKDSTDHPSQILSSLLANHSGYSPSVGVYWSLSDIKKKFGDRVAAAIEAIGGTARLQGMTTDQRRWVEKDFIEAYGKIDR